MAQERRGRPGSTTEREEKGKTGEKRGDGGWGRVESCREHKTEEDEWIKRGEMVAVPVEREDSVRKGAEWEFARIVTSLSL